MECEIFAVSVKFGWSDTKAWLMELQLSAKPSVKGGSLGKTVYVVIQLHAQIVLELFLNMYLHAIKS